MTTRQVPRLTFCGSGSDNLIKGSHQKKLKKHPLPSPEAVRKMFKILDKLSYLGLFCHFVKDKMGQNFHKIEAVRLEGGVFVSN